MRSERWEVCGVIVEASTVEAPDGPVFVVDTDNGTTGLEATVAVVGADSRELLVDENQLTRFVREAVTVVARDVDALSRRAAAAVARAHVALAVHDLLCSTVATALGVDSVEPEVAAGLRSAAEQIAATAAAAVRA